MALVALVRVPRPSIDGTEELCYPRQTDVNVWGELGLILDWRCTVAPKVQLGTPIRSGMDQVVARGPECPVGNVERELG